MKERRPPPKTRPRDEAAEAEEDLDELPVVARMVVEIRSDGTRTVARGALEDRVEDQRVALQIDARSPLALVKSLGRALLAAPSLATKWRARTRRRAALPGSDRSRGSGENT